MEVMKIPLDIYYINIVTHHSYEGIYKFILQVLLIFSLNYFFSKKSKYILILFSISYILFEILSGSKGGAFELITILFFYFNFNKKLFNYNSFFKFISLFLLMLFLFSVVQTYRGFASITANGTVNKDISFDLIIDLFNYVILNFNFIGLALTYILNRIGPD